MPSPWQLALVLILAVVLFGGRGKISSIMTDLAGGIKAFKKGMADDDDASAQKAVDADTSSRASVSENDDHKTPSA